VVKRDAFSDYHPFVGLVYFVVVIGFAMFILHPVMLVISFVCAGVYAFLLRGVRVLMRGLVLLLPMMLVAAAMNPLFNHRGVTILTYLPNGNPVTLEAVLYGLAVAGMLATVITWFVAVNAVMTADKIVFLFGRFWPALSLLLSMSLRFVPRMIRQGRVIVVAQKGLGRKPNALKVISILMTWALENSIETANSMTARGYGLRRRTAFHLYKFHRRDVFALGWMITMALVVGVGVALGVNRYRFFPSVQFHALSGASVIVFVSYFALGAVPIILRAKEVLVWKRINSAM